MQPSLKISKCVITRIQQLKEPITGKLYGTFFNNTLLIIGIYIEDNNSHDIVHSFPTEIDLCGVFKVDNEKLDDDEANNITEDILVTDNPVYLHKKLSLSVAQDLSHGHDLPIQAKFIVNGRLTRVEYTVVEEEEIYSEFIHIRLKTKMPLVCDLNQEAIVEAINQLSGEMCTNMVAFNVNKTSIYLLGNGISSQSGVTGNSLIGEVYDGMKGTEIEAKKKKGSSRRLDILCVNMFKKTTIDPFCEAVKKHAPIVHIDKRLGQTLMVALEIDALSMVHRRMKMTDLYDVLIESTHRNLRLMKDLLLKDLEDGGDHRPLSFPETLHFFPEACGHFITRVYDKKDSDSALYNDRAKLHQEFLLPMNYPIFRRSNRYLFEDECEKQLINPHESVKPTNNGGEVALVKGKYAYYHYLQDKMDDNGWGCAYRSLQTLASWFRLQGYTEKSVPTFQEIQKCLIDIGDKPSKFIGSKQWIGSTEVNYVLSSLLSIDCKIIYVSTGEELSTTGPELLYHFQTHGSPIMIGGGVLAHTILGVDYNRDTGTIKFLILDPHYTGAEDLQTIIKKGWCGWKGMEFWDKRSYYNMCLPQVPSGL